ncbi:hypothetical protein NDU88_003352 [Pleurodeles waltl]|uniref:Syntaxin N-terminal domain-containing protein n=1 Tax=Pleurodeles waltl TaxID=8319 RepID=A0AAV7QEN5_PLEWA|nr:hypothetical protein NDU88_003352 [Pleurodeles waltl]
MEPGAAVGTDAIMVELHTEFCAIDSKFDTLVDQLEERISNVEDGSSSGAKRTDMLEKLLRRVAIKNEDLEVHG